MVESERDKLRGEIGGLQVRVSAVPSLKADVQYLEGRLKSTSDLLENRVYNLNWLEAISQIILYGWKILYSLRIWQIKIIMEKYL